MAKKNPPKYGNWLKNFGNSVAFSSKEVMTEMAPSIGATASGMSADVRELKDTIKKLRKDKRAIVNYLLGEDENVSKYAGEAIKNLKHGLKTGDFVNEKRSDAAMMKAFGFDDESMGLDFNSSDDDFSFDDEDMGMEGGKDLGSVSMGPAKVFAASGMQINKSLGMVNDSVNDVSKTVANGISELDKSNKKSIAIELAINEKFFNHAAEKLELINNNLVSMVEFNNKSMSTFVEGSLKYYQDSLNVLNSILAGVNRVAPEKKEAGYDSYQGALDETMGSGGFSLGGYSKAIAKNAKTAFQDNFGLFTLFNNPMLIADFAANPMKEVLKIGINKIIPKVIENGVKELDKNFKSFVPALLRKITEGSGSDNLLTSLLSQIFGIKPAEVSNKFKTDNYDRGTMTWDGEAKKALTEVIPGYLAKINYTLESIRKDRNENAPDPTQMMYSFSKGKFSTIENERAEYKKNERDAALGGMSNIRYAMQSGTRGALKSGDDAERINVIVDKVLDEMVHTNFKFNPRKAESISGLQKIIGNHAKDEKTGGVDQKFIMTLFQNLPKDLQMELYGNAIFSGRDNLNRFYRENQQRGGSGGINDAYMLHSNVFTPEKTTTSGREYVNEFLKVYKDEFGHNKIDKEDFAQAKKWLGDFGKGVKLGNADDLLEAAKKKSEAGMSDKDKLSVEELQNKFGSNPEDVADLVKKGIKNGTYSDTKNEKGTLSGQLGKLNPINMIAASMQKVDQWMYDVIFGTDSEDSVFSQIITGIKSTFKATKEWLDKSIFTPIKTALFGEDIAKSKWFQDLKGSMTELLVGKKDEKGKYSGGVFSSIRNVFSDFGKSVKNEWETYMKPMFSSLGDTMKEYIFGKEDSKDPNAKKMSVMDRISITLQHGFSSWSSLFFGDAGTNRKKNGEEAIKSFKEAMPSAIRGGMVGVGIGALNMFGGFGILGTLFLPGGPIGGAIVGGAIGLLHRSEAFQNLIYGEKDEKGERTGGLITKGMQNFFTKHKTAIVGGAAFGVLKTALLGGGVGLIPAVTLGAIGPVLSGSLWGIITHSEAMQRLMFGRQEKDANGNTIKRVGGILNNSLMRKLKVGFPRAVAGGLGMAAGSAVLGQMGIVGSMLALGPFPAAIAGAALGLATASKGFTRNFFGYNDPKTGEYHEGALDRVKNFFSVKLFRPLGNKITKEIENGGTWLKKNITIPLARAFTPIKELAKLVGNTIEKQLLNAFSDIGKNIKEVFHNITAKILTMFGILLAPLKTAANATFGLLKTVTKVGLKTAISPLLILGALSSDLVKGNAYFGNVHSHMKNFGSQLATGGLGDVVKAGGGLFTSLFDNQYGGNQGVKNIKADKANLDIEEAEVDKQDRENKKKQAARAEKLAQDQFNFQKNGWRMTSAQKKEKEDAYKKRKSDYLKRRLAARNTYTMQQDQEIDTQQAILNNQIDNPEAGVTSEDIATMQERLKKQKEASAVVDKASEATDVPTALASAQLTTLNNIWDTLKSLFGTTTNIEKNTDPKAQAEAQAEEDKKEDTKLLNEQAKKFNGSGGTFTGLGTISDKNTQIQSASVTDYLKKRAEDNSAAGGAEEEKKKKQEALDNSYKEQELGIWRKMLNFVAGPEGSKPGKARRNAFSILDSIGTVASLLFGVGKGIFGLMNFGAGITTILGGIALGLKLFFGDKSQGSGNDRMLDANGAGNLGRKALGTVAGHGAGFAYNIARATGKSVIDFGVNTGSKMISSRRSFKGAMDAAEEMGYAAPKWNSTGKSLSEKFANSKYGSKVVDYGTKIVDTINAKKEAILKVGEGNTTSNKFLVKVVAGINKSVSTWVNGDSMKDLVKNGKILKLIPKMFGELAVKLTTPSVWEKFMSIAKGSKTILAAIGRTVGGSIPVAGQIAVGALVVYDGVTGLMDADKMFDVAPEDVDWKMRIISAAVNVLFNLPYLNLIDCALSVISLIGYAFSDTMFARLCKEYLGVDITAFDHRKLIGQLIYKLSSSDEDNANLQQNQQAMQDRYYSYLKEHGLSPDQMNMEEYRNTVKPGFWNSVGSPLIKSVLGIQDEAGADGKPKSFYELVKGSLFKAVDWFQTMVDELLHLRFGDFLRTLFGFPTKAENKTATPKDTGSSADLYGDLYKKNLPGYNYNTANNNSQSSSGKSWWESVKDSWANWHLGGNSNAPSASNTYGNPYAGSGLGFSGSGNSILGDTRKIAKGISKDTKNFRNKAKKTFSGSGRKPRKGKKGFFGGDNGITMYSDINGYVAPQQVKADDKAEASANSKPEEPVTSWFAHEVLDDEGNHVRWNIARKKGNEIVDQVDADEIDSEQAATDYATKRNAEELAKNSDLNGNNDVNNESGISSTDFKLLNDKYRASHDIDFGDLDTTGMDEVAYPDSFSDEDDPWYKLMQHDMGYEGREPTQEELRAGTDQTTYYTQFNNQYGGKSVAPNTDVPSYATIAEAGCGPTALAMASSMLTGGRRSPMQAVQSVQNEDLKIDTNNFKNVGINESYFTSSKTLNNMGLEAQMISANENGDELKEQLRSGRYAILGGSSANGHDDTPFTLDGHYVMIRSVADNGARTDPKTAVYDPLGQKSGVYSLKSLLEASVQNGGFGVVLGDKKDGGISHITGDNTSESDRAKKAAKNKSSRRPVDGKKIVAAAMRYVTTETPYDMYGSGTAPGQPMNCSRFVACAYQDAGYPIGSLGNQIMMTDQIYDAFKKLKGIQPPTYNPEPGDIIFWNHNGEELSHVGICTGEGKGVIHASGNSGQGKVVKVDSYDWGGGYSIAGFAKAGVLSGSGSNSGTGNAKDGKPHYKKNLIGFLEYMASTIGSVTMANISGRKWKAPDVVWDDPDKPGTGGSSGGSNGGKNGTHGKATGKIYNNVAKIKYSRGDNTIAALDKDGNVLASYECRNEVVPGTNDEGKPRSPVRTGTYEGVHADDPNQIAHDDPAFGSFLIHSMTTDEDGSLNGKDIHGGGSSLDNPFNDRQGWCPTYGCMRMQNEDGIELSKSIIASGNSLPLEVTDGDSGIIVNNDSGSSGGGDKQVSIDDPDGVKHKIWNYLIQQGYGRMTAAAIMGNMAQESRFNPGIEGDTPTEDGTYAYGLCQWAMSRRKALEDFASENNADPSNVDIQLKYLSKELSGSESDGLKRTQAKTTPEDAAHEFRVAFGRCQEYEAHDETRQTEARKFYDSSDFAGSGNNGFSGSGSRGFKPKRRGKKMFSGSGPGDGFVNNLNNVFSTAGDTVEKGFANNNFDKPIGSFTDVANQYSRMTDSLKTVLNPVANTIKGSILSGPTRSGGHGGNNNVSGADLRDLIDPIKSLDTHSELNTMIKYLMIIATTSMNNLQEVSNSPTAPSVQKQNAADRLARARRLLTDGYPVDYNLIEDLMKTNDKLSSMTEMGAETAISIAQGGDFKA